MNMKKEKFVKVKFLYTQEQLPFIEWLHTRYSSNKFGYIIKVGEFDKRSSILRVKESKFEEVKFLCAYTNIKVYKEFEIR